MGINIKQNITKKLLQNGTKLDQKINEYKYVTQ